jgi:uncharacterized protein YlxP (DUF503 family)
MPVIGVLTLELRLEEAHSLKDKRHWVRGLKDRLRAGRNLAVAEIDYHDLWQRSLVSAVTISPSRDHAARTLQSAEEAAAAFLGPNLVAATIEWLD